MKTKGEMAQLHADEALLTFHDVAACFSEKEWKLLHKWQKEVYNNVMKELHQALTSLGPLIATSIFSIRAPVNEDLTFEDHQQFETIYDIESNTRYPVFNFNTEMRTEQECESSLVEPSVAKNSAFQNGCISEHASATTFESVVIKGEEEEIYCMDLQKSDRIETISSPADIPYLNVKRMDEHQYADEEENHIGLNSGSSLFNTNIASEVGEEELTNTSKVSYVEHTVAPSSDSGRKKARKPKLCLKNTKKPKQYGPPLETSNETEYQFPLKQQYSRSSMWLENTMERQNWSATEFGNRFCNTTQSGLHNAINNKEKCEKYDCESNRKKKVEVFTFKPITEKILGTIMVKEGEETSSAEGNLIAHIRKHTRAKVLHCIKCGKNFSQKANLIRHQRIHKEGRKRPYYCTVCKKTFSQKYHLVTHMRIHSGERPFKCTECNRTFNVKSNLSTHYRLHSGDKPFQCSECEKCFSQRSHLIAHESKHTGVKPYQCTKCDKSFSCKGSLVRHQSTHRY